MNPSCAFDGVARSHAPDDWNLRDGKRHVKATRTAAAAVAFTCGPDGGGMAAW